MKKINRHPNRELNKTNIVKMVILSKVIYRFLKEQCSTSQKTQKPRTVKTILTNEGTARGISIPI